MDFPTLARQCAPAVHITTLAAVVRHESGFDPLVIGVNGKPHRSIRPKSRQEAVDHIRKLLAQGADFDVGYGQINVRNWAWLGVTPESILDPCVNLASAQRVLVGCYQRAAKVHGPGQTALYAAFSCYNTGNLTAGFKNGYVVRVAAAGGVQLPALSAPPPVKTRYPAISPSGTKESDKAAPPIPKSDAFGKPRDDAFATGRPDAFMKTEDLKTEDVKTDDAFMKTGSDAFGRPIPLAHPRR